MDTTPTFDVESGILKLVRVAPYYLRVIEGRPVYNGPSLPKQLCSELLQLNIQTDESQVRSCIEGLTRQELLWAAQRREILLFVGDRSDSATFEAYRKALKENGSMPPQTSLAEKLTEAWAFFYGLSRSQHGTRSKLLSQHLRISREDAQRLIRILGHLKYGESNVASVARIIGGGRPSAVHILLAPAEVSDEMAKMAASEAGVSL